MARDRRNAATNPADLRMNGAEEISVGAFARRELQRRIAIGVFGVLLVLAAIFLYAKLRSASSAPTPDEYTVRVHCRDCGHEAELHVPIDQRFPVICTQCNAKAAYPTWRCRACDHEFAPATTAPEMRCPKCGSLEVGSAASKTPTNATND